MLIGLMLTPIIAEFVDLDMRTATSLSVRPGPATGYGHALYAASLAEFGRPHYLPGSQGWLLERPIPGTDARDAIGCYPLFSCLDWSSLGSDLEDMEGSLVSVTLVPDPFGDHTPELLSEIFPDACTPFKDHYVVDLEQAPEAFVCRRHQRNVRKGCRQLIVEVCSDPLHVLDDWVRLYDVLIARHSIKGIVAFSRESFRKCLQTPGLVVFCTSHQGAPVGMLLWFVRGDVAYYHLGASDEIGYSLRAPFALFWSAIKHFAALGLRSLDLGGAAGVDGGHPSGLRAFKAGWSTGTKTAFLCGRILDRARYAELVNSDRFRSTPYFPAYRLGEFC